MTNKKQNILNVGSAIEAAETAEEKVAAIQAAIVAGDPNVKAGDLETAEADARLARLRIEVARQTEADREEQQRVDAVHALRREITDTIDDPSPYLDALRKVEEAAVEWLDLNDARAEQMRAWRRRLRELGVAETSDWSTTPPEPFGIAPLSSQHMKLDIRIDGGHVAAVDAERYLKDLFALPAAAIRDPSRRPVDLRARLTGELGYIPRRGTDTN